MDLSTNYMGLELKNPVIVGSSGLTNTVGNIQKCEDAGAGAVVIKSLFEEQILAKVDTKLRKESMYFWFAEAADAVKNVAKESDLEDYLQLIKKSKESVSIPVIASINCVSAQEWPSFAKSIQEAGADAIELNISIFPFENSISCDTVESTYIDIVKQVKSIVTIPVSVKIGYYFSNINGMVSKLKDAGADAVVLFNRFYKPDIDIDSEEITATKGMSSPDEIGTTLRWVGLLSKESGVDISATTGVHDGEGVIKQLLAGASTVQLCTTLYKNGIKYIGTVLADIEKYMNKKNYKSAEQFRGKLASHKENMAAFERIQFMKRNFDNY